MGLGYVEGVTHDYERHGTTTLFAALDIANGQVVTDCKPRHRNQEFLAFLKQIEANVPSELDVYLVMDNYSTHKHAKVKAWFARHPRFHPHFIPTYASWLNQVERWFALITQKAIRRGSFRSVKDLVSKIEQFVAAHNKRAKPFVWVATADSILAKIERLCGRISGTGQPQSPRARIVQARKRVVQDNNLLVEVRQPLGRGHEESKRKGALVAFAERVPQARRVVTARERHFLLEDEEAEIAIRLLGALIRLAGQARNLEVGAQARQQLVYPFLVGIEDAFCILLKLFLLVVLLPQELIRVLLRFLVAGRPFLPSFREALFNLMLFRKGCLKRIDARFRQLRHIGL